MSGLPRKQCTPKRAWSAEARHRATSYLLNLRVSLHETLLQVDDRLALQPLDDELRQAPEAVHRVQERLKTIDDVVDVRLVSGVEILEVPVDVDNGVDGGLHAKRRDAKSRVHSKIMSMCFAVSEGGKAQHMCFVNKAIRASWVWDGGRGRFLKVPIDVNNGVAGGMHAKRRDAK